MDLTCSFNNFISSCYLDFRLEYRPFSYSFIVNLAIAIYLLLRVVENEVLFIPPYGIVLE